MSVFVIHLKTDSPDRHTGRKLATLLKWMGRYHGFTNIHNAEWPDDLAEAVADNRNRRAIEAILTASPATPEPRTLKAEKKTTVQADESDSLATIAAKPIEEPSYERF